MYIHNCTGRQISFDFWVKKSMPEDRNLLKKNFWLIVASWN